MKLAKVLIAVLACTSLLLAQEATAPKAGKGAKKEAGASIFGTLVSADAVANMIIVKVKKGEDTLGVDASVKILSGKDTIQLGDIKADSKLKIKFKTVDGKKVATKISVITPAEAAAHKAKKAKKMKAEKKEEAAPAGGDAPAAPAGGDAPAAPAGGDAPAAPAGGDAPAGN